jgi:hypothetical protein
VSARRCACNKCDKIATDEVRNRFTVKSATRSSATTANGLSIAQCAMGHSVGESKVTSYCEACVPHVIPCLECELVWTSAGRCVEILQRL